MISINNAIIDLEMSIEDAAALCRALQVAAEFYRNSASYTDESTIDSFIEMLRLAGQIAIYQFESKPPLIALVQDRHEQLFNNDSGIPAAFAEGN